MEFRFLQESDFDILYPVYLEAFSDYIVKMQPEREQLLELFARRALHYQISVGAFDDDKLVGFNLNGMDQWAGALTVYDLSTGIIPAYRGKNLTTRMFNFSLPGLRSLNAQQYLLEVIESNERALKAYTSIGFQQQRRFACFQLKSPRFNDKKLMHTDIDYRAETDVDWQTLEQFWDWQLSWQNSINSIKRGRDRKVIICAWDKEYCAGYGIIYPASGDIPQVAVDKRYRRRGIGTAIVNELLKRLPPGKVARILNIDDRERGAIAFLHALNCEHFINQKEMLLYLS